MWRVLSRILRVVEVAVISVGLVGLWLAATELQQIRKTTSADLMLRFDSLVRLDQGNEIIELIEINRPILVENGGPYSTKDLDKYLGAFELLSNVFDVDLISEDMLCTSFSDWLARAYRNAEIRSYLERIRAEDSRYFTGYEAVAQAVDQGDICL